MRTDLATTQAIIVASFVLHNLAVTTRIIDERQIGEVNVEQHVDDVVYENEYNEEREI